jgi:hypothetical protein
MSRTSCYINHENETKERSIEKIERAILTVSHNYDRDFLGFNGVSLDNAADTLYNASKSHVEVSNSTSPDNNVTLHIIGRKMPSTRISVNVSNTSTNEHRPGSVIATIECQCSQSGNIFIYCNSIQ